MARRKIINRQNTTGPWNEIIGLILMGIALVIFLALISYDSSDPSLNSVGGNARTRNWIGPMGAKLADALYQAFGIAALIVPVMLYIIGRWQWDDDESEVSKPKILGLFLMIVAATGWITMISPEKPASFYWGGFVGQWLMYGPGIGMARLLGNLGAFVGLVILFTIGLLLGTNYTLIGLVDNWSQSRPDGAVAGWTHRLRLWKQGRNPQPMDVVQPGQVYAKFDQRKRANRQGASLGGMKVTVRPGVPSGRHTFSSGQEFNGEIGDHPEQIEEPVIATADDALQAVGSAQARSQSAAHIPPSSTSAPSKSAGPAGRNQRRGSGSDIDHEPDQEVEPVEEDFDDDGLSSQRTVEEMMATASVRRAESAEASLEKGEKGGKSKFGQLVKNISRVIANYKLPSTEMLTPPAPRSEMAEAELMERARQLAEKCAEFNVSGQVKQISPGPVVTTFEFKPDPGVKYSRITSLVDDLCLALKAESVRIDRIPGKSTVGIEVPNSNREMIRLREVLESKRFHESKSKLTLALGKTIDGANYVADLAKMPHLLIAGATGAGKSTALNTILASLLYKASPDEVKLILIDPKRLELGLYGDIPHLLSPIVIDPKRASYALKWAVAEMESRYKHLASFGVRNIDQYNAEVNSNANSKRGSGSSSEEEARPLPYIVVIIDELADLMMVSARDVEESITRLAQMARAVGIHLVLATQRPSVDVITGLIKANFPSRISFRVSSKVDSRTIIDSNGAEQLLGQGDMLFLPPGTSRLVRVHGAYVDEKEVKRISDFVRSQAQPAYDEKIGLSEKELQGDDFGDARKDEKYDEAVRIVIEMGRASTSVLQRRLRIGYGRAASIIDMMEREGIVGPEDGSKPRQVLVKADFLERLDQIREEDDL
ncbi:MAG: DNA translocase FtsK [Acidobacteria bacterium]|nr:DNA translocase FtsK [Acidobacteriota bacterium]